MDSSRPVHMVGSISFHRMCKVIVTFVDNSAHTGLWSDRTRSAEEYRIQLMWPASLALQSTRSHQAGARRFFSGRSSYTYGMTGGHIGQSQQAKRCYSRVALILTLTGICGKLNDFLSLETMIQAICQTTDHPLTCVPG